VGQRPGPAESGKHSRRHAVLPPLLLFAMLAATMPANAAGDAPKPLTSHRVFDQSRPGVQLITVEFSALLNVPAATVTEANGGALEAIVAERIRRDEIQATQAAVRGAIEQGGDRTPREILGLPLVPVAAGAGVAVVVLVAVMLVLVSRRRRRRRERADAPAGDWAAPGGLDTRPAGAWSTQPAAAPNARQEGVWRAAPDSAWNAEQQEAWSGGESSPPMGVRPASAALQSWWDREESRTTEVPTANHAEPAKGVYNLCGNCGVRNHPSLRYCEQCWTLLVA